MKAENPNTGSVNGKLWGERAQDWAAFQEIQCRAVYEAVLNRSLMNLRTRYLDAGCGAGLALQIASDRGAIVSGLDASASLLHIARERTPAADHRQGELEELPFADDSFDLVTGFNSFQFAARPVAALSEARRVAAPGGTVVIMTWGEPTGMPAGQIVTALKPLLPAPPPGATPPPGPFALSDKLALTSFVRSAGLDPVEVLDVDCPWEYSDLTTALRGLGSSGVAAKARDFLGSDAVDRVHEAALQSFRQPDGSYRIGATFRCLFAKA